MDHGRTNDELLAALAQRDAQLQERDAQLREQEALVAAQQAQIDTLAQAVERLQEQLALLKKALFAPRRERYLPSPDQKLLFEAQPLAAPAEETAVPTSDEPPPRKPRTPRRKFVFPDFLPVRRQEHSLDDDQLPCGHCGSERVVIRTHVSKQIELEPAQAYVVEHVRYTYACSCCRAGDQLVTTPKPPAPLDKSPFGASVLAWVVSAKFERHLPTYRHQEMLVGPLGLWLSRPLLWKLLSGAARCLRPLAELLRQEILLSYVIQADETPVRYLGGPPGKSLQGYLFGYAGDAEHRYLSYDFQPHRNRDGPRAVLGEFRGVLQSDGYSAYESLVREFPERLTAAGCWMHARRYFDEALATTSHPLAAQSLAAIQLLYDVDDRAKGLSFADRRALHERESGPIVERLFASWDEARPTLRPTTKLAEAVGYAASRRAELTRFFDDGRIALDTGHLERSLRPVAIGRKNYLFYGSLRGGQAAAVLYSVVQSARLYHLDTMAYLTDVLGRLAALAASDPSGVLDVDALRPLLPDRWAASHREHVHASRDAELRKATLRRRLTRARRRTMVVR